MTGGDLLPPPQPAPRGVPSTPRVLQGWVRGSCPPAPNPRGSWCGCMPRAPQTMGVTWGGCTCLPPFPPGPRGPGGCWCFVPPTPQDPTGGVQVSLSPQSTGSHGTGCMCSVPPTPVSQGVGACVMPPTQTTGSHDLGGTRAPCPLTRQGLRGVHTSALPGSSRAGVQVLCVTPPTWQGPTELGVHDFPPPQTK